jgi:hypothetical protein
MKRVALLTLLVWSLAFQALAADISGKWIMKLPAITQLFTFVVSGNKVTGTRTGPRGSVNLSDGMIEDSRITFSLVDPTGTKLDYTGVFKDDKIELTIENHVDPAWTGTLTRQ